LGNGFDLQCNLPTRYSDFFGNRMKTVAYQSAYDWLSHLKIVEKNTNYCIKTTISDFRDGAPLINAEFTVWDLLFLVIHYIRCSLSSNPNGEDSDFDNWADVEEQISSSVSSSTSSVVSAERIVISWRYVYRILFDQETQIYEEEYVANGQRTCFENVIADVISAQKPFPFAGERIESFFEYLLSQLRLFELSFKNYVFDAVKHNQNYDKTAHELCTKLLNSFPYPIIENFNYTSFGVGPLTMLSVHGSILPQNQIVFGIDDSNVKNTDPAYIFTKIMRELELGVNGNQILTLGTNVNVAIVYGLSLAKEDYSFFVDLFDRMNLADLQSKSVLIIDYSYYPGKEHSQIRKDIQYSLAMLINRYGEERGQRSTLLASLWHSGRLIFQLI